MTVARRGWPQRIAHRGGGSLAPENTLAAIRQGVRHGYRAVEFDVMLTADDVPVLMHDPLFGRTIAGPGRVADTAYAELAARDAGAWFDERFAGEPVPRYADVVAFCRAHGVWMNVEIKPSPGLEARTGRVVAALTAELTATLVAGRPAERPLLSSFSVVALEAAREAAPDLDRGLLVGPFDAGCLGIARALGCVSVHAGHAALDAAVIARLHAAGFGTVAYTVNDPARVVELERAGIDAIITDRLDLVPPRRPP